METKEENKTLHDKILQSVFFGEPASWRDWEVFAREGACAILIPGYTINRFGRNIGMPEKDGAHPYFYGAHEIFKSSFWGIVLYNTLQYFN